MIKLTNEKQKQQKQNLVVMKFGGSCLQDAESFEQTTNNIIQRHIRIPHPTINTAL